MTDYHRFRILTDVPSQDPTLGFRETSEGLASLISSSEARFAMAIFGPWGSGKTTLMEAIKRQLQDDPQVICVDFSAWRYEREEHLIIPLLDTIREALVDWSRQLEARGEDPGGSKKQAAQKTAETVGKVMASLLAGISFKVGLPGALELSYDANKSLEAFRRQEKPSPPLAPRPSFFGTLRQALGGKSHRDDAQQAFARRLSDPELPQSFYHACFSALAEAFRRFEELTQGTRIVVFVDDLDRCLPAGVLEVLESMKLFFDLKGFIFVVGLDREVVERCIDARYTLPGLVPGAAGQDGPQRVIRGAEYLKKIFQVPFSLAPVSVGMLGDLFLSMQQGSHLPGEQMGDLHQTVLPHLTFLFSGARLNPREVKRYINAYTIQMKVKPDLQDANIVLALNTLAFRLDCRNLYEAIATFRVEFTSALTAFLAEDPTALEDYDLTTADLPDDIRAYLGEGGVAHALLQATDIDAYLDAGEATRSSAGGYFLQLLATYRLFRGAVGRALQAGEPKDFDAAWSEANSHFRSLQEPLRAAMPRHLGPRLNGVADWLDAGRQENKWLRLLEAMNEPGKDPGPAREAAWQEARRQLEQMRALLRQVRQGSSFNEMS